MIRRLIRTVAILAILLLFAASAGFWSLATMLTKPHSEAVLLPNDLKLEPVELVTADAISLASSYLAPTKAGTGCVLLLHGNGGNRAQFVQQLRLLQKNGYGALAIDFRGQGESGGTMTTAGGFERLDADAGFAALKQRCPNRKIGVYGFSLGGASALFGSAAAQADALVLDAVYQDIQKAIYVRLKKTFGSRGAGIATRPLLWALEIKTGLRMDDMDNVRAAARVYAPTLLLIGGSDYAAPESQMRAIGKALHSRDVRYVLVPHSSHGANAAMLGKSYDPLLLDFFERNLR